MMRLAFILAALVLTPPPPANAPDLAVGQVWSIRTAKPTAARLIIGRIEPFDGGRIVVSVALVGVPTARGPISIADLPFDKATLIASLGRLIASGQPAPPGFDAGYRQWRDEHGGVFTAPVAAVIALIVSKIPPPGQAPATPPAGGQLQQTAARSLT